MAKKKKTLNLSEIVQKYNPHAGSVSDPQFKISDWIDTGCYLLNAQISGSIFKGLPVGKSLLLAGEKGTGKTLIALNIAREAQRQYNSQIYWIDTEGAMDFDTMENIGIITDKDELEEMGTDVFIQPAETIQEINTSVFNVLENVEGDDPSEVLIVVDSVGMASTDSEVENVSSGSDKVDLTYQKQLKKLFKTTLNKARYKKVSIVYVGHVYDNIGGYGDQLKIAGGRAHQYGVSTTLVLSKAKLSKDDDVAYQKELEEYMDDIKSTGIVITSKPDKSRFTKAIPIKLQVSWVNGLNRYYGLKDFFRDDDYDKLGVGPGSLKTVKKERIYTPGKVKGARNWAVKATDENITNKSFYRNASKVFTQEILKVLDEERIRPQFEFSKFTEEPIELADDDIETNEE